jgi:hypothetical protein
VINTAATATNIIPRVLLIPFSVGFTVGVSVGFSVGGAPVGLLHEADGQNMLVHVQLLILNMYMFESAPASTRPILNKCILEVILQYDID